MAITATINGESVTWKDSKRYLWLLGIFVPLLPFGAWREATRFDLSILWWLGPIWILIIIPLLDAVFGEDQSNPPEWVVEQLANDRYYRWCTYLFLPVQYASLVFACWVVTHTEMRWYGIVGYAFTVGTVAGVAINTAHELGHKSDKLERRYAKIALAQSAYGHFCVEHNRGHHNRVATPEDPASSRLGESFWAFLPRTVIGSVRSAWHLEAKRLRAQAHPVMSVHNDVISAWSITLVLFTSLTAIFGWKVLPFLIGQAIFGFSLLEVVNYIEHYGLLRQVDGNGKYQRCEPQHSWNSNHIASNVLLYQLERHSDHHAHHTRRFQALRHFDASPQLPSGYGLMLGLAYVPPVWRAVMDRRVVAHYAGDVSLANIHPKAQLRVMRKYAMNAADIPRQTPAP